MIEKFEEQTEKLIWLIDLIGTLGDRGVYLDEIASEDDIDLGDVKELQDELRKLVENRNCNNNLKLNLKETR